MPRLRPLSARSSSTNVAASSLSPIAFGRSGLVRRLPHRPREPPPFLPHLAPSPCVLLQLEMLELAQELLPAVEAPDVERAVGERRTKGAAGLLTVRAVGEATLRCQLLEVGKRRVDSLARIPELQLTHARRIEHEPGTGEEDELAVRRRVPPAAVVL